jgi:hypothetical protein
MNRESDNAVLTQLREIRAALAGHTTRFDRLERDFDELRHLVRRALVLWRAALGNRNSDEHQEQGEAHPTSMDERVSHIEQRVAKIEERLDC